MPKSRGRRTRKRSNKPQQRRPAHGSRDPAELATFVPVMQAADAAEVRGDALTALRLISEHPVDADGRLFWRPERVRRLMQLALLAPRLPRWATSRWILAQALQCLDHSSRRRGRMALDMAVLTSGGPAALHGRDEPDARATVIDHDWVYRQMFLYDLGGLDHFLRRVASPDLIVGADRIEEWARTPMGAFRFLAESRRTLRWEDLGTGATLETPNLGAASLLLPGECAIGRVVPTEAGVMFESVPLFMPESSAAGVAADPDGWMDEVAVACREGSQPEAVCRPGGHHFELLTDVPRIVQAVVQRDVSDQQDGVGLVLAALRGALDEEDLEVSPWPAVAAALLEPAVIDLVIDELGPRDLAAVSRLADDLPAPAADICRWMASAWPESA